MNAEEWRAVPGYEGMYEVSSHGRVKSLPRTVVGTRATQFYTGRILKQHLSAWGQYPLVNLSKGGKNKLARVHRLMLLAFVGSPNPGEEGCHQNGDQTDNRLENLRWGTHAENMADQVRHGKHAYAAKTHCPTGHPLSGANLAILASGRRKCKECHRETARRSRERRLLSLSGVAS